MLQKNLNKKLNYGMIVLAILLPIQTVYFLNLPWNNLVRWQFNQPAIYATDILLICLLAVGFILFKGGEGENKWRLPIYLSGLLWLLTAAVGIYTASDKPMALFAVVRLFLMLSLMWLVINFGQLKKLFVGLLLGLSLSAILGLGQFFWQSAPANKYLGLAAHNPQELGVSVIENGGRILRAYGSFEHPNIFGGMMAIGLIIAFCLIISENNRKLRLWLALGATILALGLFFSFSRAAVMASLLGLVALFLGHLAAWRRWWWPLFILAFFITLSFGFYGSLWQTRLQTQTRLEQKSIDERVLFLEQAQKLSDLKPWVGVGIGGYASALQTYKLTADKYDNQPVHNVWLLVKTEIGRFGLGAFLLFFSILILSALSSAKSGQYLSLSLLAVLGCLSFYDHWLWSLHSGLLLFFFVAGIIITQHITRNT